MTAEKNGVRIWNGIFCLGLSTEAIVLHLLLRRDAPWEIAVFETFDGIRRHPLFSNVDEAKFDAAREELVSVGLLERRDDGTWETLEIPRGIES